MKILIDTHIFLWAVAQTDRLTEEQIRFLPSPANQVYVSSVSIAEIMIKNSIGKLNIPFNPVELVQQVGFECLDFTSEDALWLKDLPFHHKDPFDRMLICQSLENNMKMMTQDSKFALYDCKMI